MSYSGSINGKSVSFEIKADEKADEKIMKAGYAYFGMEMPY